jgi:hypothetical protein
MELKLDLRLTRINRASKRKQGLTLSSTGFQSSTVLKNSMNGEEKLLAQLIF